MQEHLSIEGRIKVRALPDNWDKKTFRYWWCDELDEQGRVLRPARMDAKEKDRYTVEETHNLFTANGQLYLISYLATFAGTPALFSQWFSVGTGAIAKVSSADGNMATELARAQPTGASYVGLVETVSTLFGTTDAVGTWTNCGMWGGGTSTLGTGALLTHALIAYVKNNSTAVTVDYAYTLAFS